MSQESLQVSRRAIGFLRAWPYAPEQLKILRCCMNMTSYGVLSGLGTLQPYLMATADDLSSALQQRAIADFNDWLVRAPCSLRVCLAAGQLAVLVVYVCP